MPKEINIDSVLDRILSVGDGQANSLTSMINESEIMEILAQARQVFMNQPTLIEIEPPLKVVGDTHGQFADLIRLLSVGGFPPDTNYLFLGDYIDRGKQSLETILLLLSYKLKYPVKFFLLRGNHECQAINRVYGFYDECQRRYSTKLWNAFQEVFNYMPFVGIIGGRIIGMHGGISKDLKKLDDLRNIKRPVDPGQPGLLMDLLWSDPDKWTNGYCPNTRGVSSVFGPDAVQKFCTTFDVDLVVRAHQVVQDGYEFFASRRLVTIFSAPHYCGEFDNSAAIMSVDKDLVCSFNVLRPMGKSSVRTQG